ncbi:unnamed protein product [Leptidea sinapis]|uniref:Gustatory receptor n=1 Tax=Leptidea sinapis TaxID=189913 RepID=A0A5E4QEX6_9NEOP|nr:unnamed protein product [Leptidea sinapis]
MKIKTLKFLIKTENVLSIYRNYSSFSTVKKRLTILRIIFDFLFIIFNINNQIFVFEKYGVLDLLRSQIAIANSVFVFLLALYNAKNFKYLMRGFEETHRIFQNDEVYIKNIEVNYKQIKILFLIYFIFSCAGLISTDLEMNNFPFNLAFYINLFLCHLRYIFEFLVLYVTLFQIAQEVKCLTRSIEEYLKYNMRIKRDDTETTYASESARETLDRFNEWTKIYTKVKETSNLFNKIFGLQLRYHAFGSVAIDMTLIPKCVMFFTSYTIIVLQFNNVV